MFKGLSAVALALLAIRPAHAQGLRIEIDVSPALRAAPATGRMYVFFSRDSSEDPRLGARNESECVPFFGVDVTNLAAGTPGIIDGATLGYPLKKLGDLPPGDYYVQGLLSVYSEFHRADGHTVWAHDDQWEGQQYNKSPGNLVSEVRKIHVDPSHPDTLRLELVRAIPAITVPADTRWVRRVKIQSKLLTAFWGRPIYVGATILLPREYDKDSTTRFPTVYEQGHFSLSAPFAFDPDGKPETPSQRAERVKRTAREPGYEFAQSWTSPGFPQMIAVTFQHPTPYFDDSYAVNSVNNGPYGDAILTELIPYLESHFRMIQAPWARLLVGGSTGGWEAMALQVYHPDFFGGTWVLYPDPIDLRAYELVNVYRDSNAFVFPVSEWFQADVPAEREETGQPHITVRQESQYEAVLGSHARSGEQFAIWEATWGPVGPDGYPVDLWDLSTGKINHQVADYMKVHDYDIRDYVERNWATLGPKLRGRVHLYVGDMDTFYLNLSVYYMESFLKTAKPPADAVVEYGRPLKPHGWQPFTNAELMRQMAAYIAARRPKP
ncbi:MAG TPA: alpha/beta hydrolase-fold protein [Gemmatimonadales bacterium]|nr:alpha/beta hydrolase-fold protein [Gemmatimonadales bacterium]